MIFQVLKIDLKIYVLIFESLIEFNEAFIPYDELQFLDWPSIVAHSPADECIHLHSPALTQTQTEVYRAWISDTGS